jgi:ubiquinol-cytochrome c reductase cytochrome b subunit
MEEKQNNRIIEWIDSRLPIFTLIHKEYGIFPMPRNLNYFWSFGAVCSFMLVVMMLSGIVLAMHYSPDSEQAFDSVQNIIYKVNHGWLIHSIHKVGASFFFIAIYVHMFRSIYYGSYKAPREMIWILGVMIFLLMMATAFMGYVLPWGQTGYWAATVITDAFSSIPYIGEHITVFIRGGDSVAGPTLSRFFVLHMILPFIVCGVVALHVWALHVAGSNNPLGIDTKGTQDTLPFHPFYMVKNLFGLLVFLTIYAVFVFYLPDFFSHEENNIPANPLVTPTHITPEWYFLPFYAILRAITFNINIYALGGLAILAFLMVEFVWRRKPKYLDWRGGVPLFSAALALLFFGLVCGACQGWGIPFTDAQAVPISAKFGGVLAMFGSIALLFFLPWLDTHSVRSARFRPWFRLSVIFFTADVFLLGFAGAQSADKIYFQVFSLTFDNTMLALFGTGFYFAFFLIILPLLSRFEKAKLLPISIYQNVLVKE